MHQEEFSGYVIACSSANIFNDILIHGSIVNKRPHRAIHMHFVMHYIVFKARICLCSKVVSVRRVMDLQHAQRACDRVVRHNFYLGIPRREKVKKVSDSLSTSLYPRSDSKNCLFRITHITHIMISMYLIFLPNLKLIFYRWKFLILNILAINYKIK